MLRPAPASLPSAALASVSDSVLDGYRSVAPHLAEQRGSEVLIVSHGSQSIPLYAARTALALGASRVDFASADPASLDLAESLGCRSIETDFEKPAGRHAVVAHAGLSAEGLVYAIRATRPEGILQSTSFHAGFSVPMTLVRRYTLGIRVFIGRRHGCALGPEVLALVESGRLQPQDETTRTVVWDETPEAFLEPAIKLSMTRPE